MMNRERGRVQIAIERKAALSLAAVGLLGVLAAAVASQQLTMVPPEMRAMRKAQEALRKETAPEFYAWQKKLEADEAEVSEVVKSFAGREIDKETAKERLLPLLKDEHEIQVDPDFQAERRLAQVYFSTPEYRKKMEAIMRRYMPKPPEAPRAGRGVVRK